MPESRPILLFDIDGTLIDSAGAGGGALLRALQIAFGVADARPVKLHGRTDLGIMTELLDSHGISPSNDNLTKLSQTYFGLLPEELKRRVGRCLPGVECLIQRLTESSNAVVGILTGNMPQSAQQKLEHYGIWHHFTFGIFGDGAIHRPDLADIALTMIQSHVGYPVDSQSIVIIGDTPLDIELALRMRARCLGVCTGGFDKVALSKATRIEDNLEATDDLVAWLCATIR